MYFLLNKIPFYLWNVFAVTLVVLYLMGKTYYNTSLEKDDFHVIKFWYNVRSFVFIADILIVIGMYLYIFIK